jgi:hypothetical protein
MLSASMLIAIMLSIGMPNAAMFDYQYVEY